MELTNNELLNIVKSKYLLPVYASYDIVREYNHKLMVTPPYHCELQPIEKGWSMVKNSIAYDPDLHGTARNLKEKLDTSLRSIDEEYLVLVWKKCSAEKNLEEIDDNKLHA